jgi:hypothetical protein
VEKAADKGGFAMVDMADDDDLQLFRWGCHERVGNGMRSHS